MDYPICFICQEPMAALYSIDRFAQHFDIVRCPKCGLQRQKVLPDNAHAYYDEDYYRGKAEYSYRDERLSYKYDAFVWKARLKNIARFIRPPADFLDVGCAFGGFVRTAAEMGYRATGLDVSETTVAHARSQGLSVYQGSLATSTFLDRSLDIITMIEVLEHLENPQACLERARRLLRPGGLLVLQTANFEGLQAKHAGAAYHYYLPGHLYYYSTRNLRKLLPMYGFDRFIIYRPVDFGILPKLLKSRYNFRHIFDYWQWVRIAWYHAKGKVALRDWALTSSMVVYAFRNTDA